VARLTYAALALALIALISGFFVRTSAAPLFASIGLSALVLVLILRGWARRLRTVRGSIDDEPESKPIEVLDLETSEFVVVEPGETVAREVVSRPRKRAPREKAKPRPSPAPAATPPVRPRPVPPRVNRPAGTGSARVVVLPGRTRYHVPGCRFASGKGAQQISEAAARRRRYQPCSVCLG
jgi:hypothetical protein